MKPVDLVRVYKAIRSRKPPIPACAHLFVRAGRAMVTDLDVWAFVPVTLSDGVYQLVGKEFVPYPDDIYSLDAAPSLELEEDLLGSAIPFPRTALQAALQFTVDNPIKPLWNTICFKIRTDRMDIIATDTCALSTHVAEKPAGRGGVHGNYLVPAKAVKALLLDKHSDTLRFAAGDTYVSLATPNLSIVARRDKSEYYFTDAVIPKELSFVSRLRKKEFRAAIKSLKPYLDETHALQIERVLDGYNLTAKDSSRYLKKTVFVESSTEPGGRICTNNLMLVAPKRPPDNADITADITLLSYRYLEQVSVSIPGPDIYIGFQSHFGDLEPVTFSGEPLCGGGTI